MSEEQVILVDEQDNETGTAPKMEAHIKGLLHRAISVFIFNTKGEFLLQQRAFNKYHSSGLWSNACCSHPRPGESVQDAAERRLREEMGIACELTGRFSFIYNAAVGDHLTEHEYDYVFTGISDDVPEPDKMEVAGWKYMDAEKLHLEMEQYPERFTTWFRICLDKYMDKLSA